MPIHIDTWKRNDREPVTFDGVPCCLYVDRGKVALIPEDEVEDERWPVDVLRLTPEQQTAILKQLR